LGLEIVQTIKKLKTINDHHLLLSNLDIVANLLSIDKKRGVSCRGDCGCLGIRWNAYFGDMLVGVGDMLCLGSLSVWLSMCCLC